MVDIAKYNPKDAAAKGAKLRLKNPFTGKLIKENDKFATIELLGKDADKLAELVRELDRKGAFASDEEDKDTRSAAVIDFAVAATISWNLTEDGKELECNETSVRRLYEDQPWIMEQVLPFILSRRNFSENVQKS